MIGSGFCTAMRLRLQMPGMSQMPPAAAGMLANGGGPRKPWRPGGRIARLCPPYGHFDCALFGLDIRQANDAAVFVRLTLHVGAEYRAATSDRKQPLLGELR